MGRSVRKRRSTGNARKPATSDRKSTLHPPDTDLAGEEFEASEAYKRALSGKRPSAEHNANKKQKISQENGVNRSCHLSTGELAEHETSREELREESLDHNVKQVVDSDNSGRASESSSNGEEDSSKSDGEGSELKESSPPVANVLSSKPLVNVHVTVVLENANLESVKLSSGKGGFALLNSDDHSSLLRKTKRDANDARPDITHQCLLALLDSPLNKAGHLTVYIRTKKNVLIAVHPQTRIPRTIKRFSGLMVELLQKFKVRSTSGAKPLLQVIRNPVTSHLPVGQRRILCTYNCDNVVDIREHAKNSVSSHLDNMKLLSSDSPDAVDQITLNRKDPVQVLYVIGAMAHGKVDVDWTDEQICISEYPLSAATVCSRITYAYECLMGIL